MKAIYPPPDRNVLHYQRKLPSGRFEIATIQSLVVDEYGNWRAQFLTPGQSPEYLNQNNNTLAGWEPVYTLLEEDRSQLIEEIAQRVVEVLQKKGINSPTEVVSKGMKVVRQKTVAGAVKAATTAKCEECDREFANAGGLALHRHRKHKQANSA